MKNISCKTVIEQVKKLLDDELANNFLKPKIDFYNIPDSYIIRVKIPKSLVDKLKVDLDDMYVSLSLNNSLKRISLPQRINKSEMRTRYNNGVYSIEIPKKNENPGERLNQLAFAMM